MAVRSKPALFILLTGLATQSLAANMEQLARQCNSGDRQKACRDLIDALAHDKNKAARLQAISRIEDSETLATIALKNEDEGTRNAAFERFGSLGLTIHDSSGVTVGAAVIYDHTLWLGGFHNDLSISLLIRRLSPGQHAISVNEYPKCEGPQFASSGEPFLTMVTAGPGDIVNGFAVGGDGQGAGWIESTENVSGPVKGLVSPLGVSFLRVNTGHVGDSASALTSSQTAAGIGRTLRLIAEHGGGAIIIGSGPTFSSGDRIACGVIQ